MKKIICWWKGHIWDQEVLAMTDRTHLCTRCDEVFFWDVNLS